MKILRFALLIVSLTFLAATADEPRAFIDGTGPGWKQLTVDDFLNVNCDEDTWTGKDGDIHCTGKPIGVCRTKTIYTNFELVAQWRHNKSAGNSGIFVWVPEEALKDLKPGKLPGQPPAGAGIEVQILDHGYVEQYEKRTKKKADFFTTNGDIFPVGKAKMRPFPPTSPNGSRSFPRKNLSKGVGEWNHYYVRAINGEIRLWVNGEEVSGGDNIEPRTGYLCLESEGSPIDFKDIRIRELP
ncbi:MAG TPA: DUF1080 domain-containing protein [Gemmataceae bacterium]|jgi:hypothetical protein